MPRTPGVIGAQPPHLLHGDEQKTPEIDSLTIDIGATSETDAKGKVKEGDYGTFATQFSVLSDDDAWPTVLGKAFDDRAGCSVLVELLQATARRLI